MIPPVKVKEAIRRLRNENEFTILVEYLKEVREEKRLEMEDANAALQTHKLQGYCQALTDFIKSCSN